MNCRSLADKCRNPIVRNALIATAQKRGNVPTATDAVRGEMRRLKRIADGCKADFDRLSKTMADAELTVSHEALDQMARAYLQFVDAMNGLMEALDAIQCLRETGVGRGDA